MPRALLLVALLLPAAPAAAQTYDSGFRFGLGLDYGGLAGRGDGGVGGLRLTAGARVHDNVAVYWQGQALGGAFVEPERVIGVFQGWNSVLVEADETTLGRLPELVPEIAAEAGAPTTTSVAATPSARALILALAEPAAAPEASSATFEALRRAAPSFVVVRPAR